MCYEGGIREFATFINRNKDPLHSDVIYMSGAREDSMAEVAMQYNDGYQEVMVSFANNVHTPEGGMHEEGFRRALTNALNAYGRKIKMLKDDEKVSGEDCREGVAEPPAESPSTMYISVSSGLASLQSRSLSGMAAPPRAVFRRIQGLWQRQAHPCDHRPGGGHRGRLRPE